MIKILIGGSPCVHWSIVRSPDDRETQATGLGWELFKNYIIAKEKFKPDYFLYENNKSISKDIKVSITKELGVVNQNINSHLVSAQSREREYWHNIEDVKQPDDRNIKLPDILEDDVINCLITRPRFKETKCRMYFDKSPTITAATGGGHIPRALFKGYIPSDVTVENYQQISRELKVSEVEKLQTLPVGYTEGLSKTAAMNSLGSGWTAEIIIHILSHMNIPKDEEVIVLSMYDGIATGRYCLDKLGYKNITYYAYEINPASIKAANKNYPDIIQCGDAFDVRKDEWFLTYK
jgi:site-specific DNA-cytosine methylase